MALRILICRVRLDIPTFVVPVLNHLKVHEVINFMHADESSIMMG